MFAMSCAVTRPRSSTASITSSSAPSARISCMRSSLKQAEMTIRARYPFARQTRASAGPVLPPVYSTTVVPGAMSASRSAPSIIESAIRSFIDPVGFRYSSLTQISAPFSGASARRRASGVDPIASRTVAARMPWTLSRDAHRDRAEVARAVPVDAQHRSLAPVSEDGIGRVPHVPAGPARVGRPGEDGVRERVWKVELAGMDDVAGDVHFHMDVDGAALVPARVDRAERRNSLGVGALDPAHERSTGCALAEAGVDAGRVGVPDVDRRALDRPAGRGVDDAEPQRERGPRPVVGDVPAQLLVRDVVRTLGLLRGQHARHGPGGHRRGAGAVGGGDLPGAQAECTSEETEEARERSAAGDELVHGDE